MLLNKEAARNISHSPIELLLFLREM